MLGLRRFLLPLALLVRMTCMCHDEAPIAAAAVSGPTDAPAPAASNVAPLPVPAPLLPVDPSPFHDAVVSYFDPEEAMLPNALTLCPFEGRTYVCGVSDVPLVSTEAGVVNDAAAEAAIAAGKGEPLGGRPFLSTGSWPHSALLLATEPGTYAVHAYRYANDAWTPAGEWQSGGLAVAAAWGREFLVTDVAVRGDVLGGPTYALRRTRREGGFASPPTSRVLPANAQVPSGRASPLVALASHGNALFMAVRQGWKLVGERHINSEKAPLPLRVDGILDVGPSVPLTAHLWVGGADDAVLYGAMGDHDKPVFQRFDGERWTALTLPAGTTRVAAYDRTSAGVERVFAYVGDALSLFERAKDAPAGVDSWRSILLPSLPPGDRFHDVRLANDDAWLLVWPRNTRARAPHLMRLSPVERVWTYPTRTR